MQLNNFSHFQSRFHARWGDLNDRHVRALGWLLCSPDLLDSHAPIWSGRIAALHSVLPADLEQWLHLLDAEPASLHAYLGMQPIVRLGRYAEKLLAFFLERQSLLAAHGVQVRAEKNNTIGEFDFLLHSADGLLHWELATKFYLLESSGHGSDAVYFVGPNLADTLGAKMRKIFDRQLMLSQHPSAQAVLPGPVVAAQALVKGWLFYPATESITQMAGTSPEHCRGFWLSQSDVRSLAGQHFAVLSRLEWLAPAKLPIERGLTHPGLTEMLDDYFKRDSMPLMIVQLEELGGALVESARGFVVPDDWKTRAGYRIKPIGTD